MPCPGGGTARTAAGFFHVCRRFKYTPSAARQSIINIFIDNDLSYTINDYRLK